MRFLSKKVFFVVSIIISILALVVVEELRFCHYVLGYRAGCLLPIDDIYESLIFTLSALTLPISLLTLPLKPVAFEAWKRFAVWAIPLIVLATLFLSGASSGGGVGVVGFPPVLLMVPVFILYFLISLTIIIRVWWKSRQRTL